MCISDMVVRCEEESTVVLILGKAEASAGGGLNAMTSTLDKYARSPESRRIPMGLYPAEKLILMDYHGGLSPQADLYI